MNEDKKTAVEIPEAIQAQAGKLIEQACQLFSNHFRQLADDLAAFGKTRQDAQRRIDRGARRTDGHIV
jgi:hypothetical protein